MTNEHHVRYVLVTARAFAFTGEGARQSGGRWNSRGRVMVYSSISLSSAALETSLHADRRRFERTYVAFHIDIPDDAATLLDDASLPPDWRARPVSLGARALGDAWLARGQSLALSEPSVLVPVERNLLLNPAHPRFAALNVSEPVAFRFDDRL